MTKDRYNELAWLDQLEQDVHTKRAKRLLKARYERQARVVPTTRFQRLLGTIKRFLGA